MNSSVIPSTSATVNLRILRALIAKDWRFFRVPTLVLLIATGLWFAYCMLIWGLWITRHADMEPASSFLDLVNASAAYSAGVVALIAAAFGGTAIAGERAAGTADFLDLLPVTRMQIVLSKCLVTAATVGTCLVIPGVVALWFLLHGTPRHEHDNGDQYFIMTTAFAELAVGFFGIAWMLGAVIKSAPISACVGIALTIAIVTLAVVGLHAVPHEVPMEKLVMTVSTVGLGITGIVVGTACYLRRISP